MPLRTLRPLLGLLCSLPVFFSCSPEEHPQIDSIVGTWESLGYGWGLEITDSTYAFYELTSESCLPGKTGKLDAIAPALSLEADTLYCKVGFDVYRYIPRPGFLERCGSQEITTNPEANFAVFAATVADHFAYFEDNQLNWDSLYRVYHAKITPKTSEEELFLIIEEMLLVMGDNHGYVEPSDEVYEAAESLRKLETVNENLKEYGDFVIARMVAETFLDEDLTEGHGTTKWGTIQDSIGYLQINAMMLHAELELPEELLASEGFVGAYFTVLEEYIEPKHSELEVAGIRKSMELAMADLAETNYIMLDVRFNGGGNDDVSLEILRHFNKEKRLVATKKARAQDGYSPKVPIYLEAADQAYTKPVYILTSRQSASATDFMVLSSLAMDNAIRVGSRTNGALSDALGKTLPNGWYFSISNEVYEDTQGICYETIGVPPDYELNYDEDRQTFFRAVADDLEGDKQQVLETISAIRSR
jgi:carboxyl-terminal processing protease